MWQHLHCYGYAGDDDSRLPTDHVCYQCLLGHDEEQTLKKMELLACKRRGMYLAIEDGLKTQKDFVIALGMESSAHTPLDPANARLGLDAAVATSIYQHLRNEGYVVAAKGSHRAGFAASGKPLLVAVKSGPNHEKMLRNLFDPMLHINHRVSNLCPDTGLLPH